MADNLPAILTIDLTGLHLQPLEGEDLDVKNILWVTYMMNTSEVTTYGQLATYT